jgi:hypothetical protein
MSDNNLQEAPASVTFSITSPGGFNALFTVREMSGMALLTKMVSIEAKLTEMGYKPQERFSKPAGTTSAWGIKSAPKTDCTHSNITTKKASGHNKPENKDRLYSACLDCGRFIKWL